MKFLKNLFSMLSTFKRSFKKGNLNLYLNLIFKKDIYLFVYLFLVHRSVFIVKQVFCVLKQVYFRS